MSRPDPDLKLRLDLFEVATKKYRVPLDEAEDLADKAWIAAWIWPERCAPGRTRQDVAAYAFWKLRRLWIDSLRSPKRTLNKRIDVLISRSAGGDPIEAWVDGSQTILGPKSLRSIAPLTDSDFESLPMSDFLYGKNGLAGDSPMRFATRHLLDAFFKWSGKPVGRDAFVNLFAPIHVEKLSFLPIEDFDAQIEFKEARMSLHEYWSEIIKLPSKMLAAILLPLEEDLLESLQPGFRELLPELIHAWSPPPPLAELELPADDSLVAERLGIKKGHLQVLRNRAREILQRGFAKWRTE